MMDEGRRKRYLKKLKQIEREDYSPQASSDQPPSSVTLLITANKLLKLAIKILLDK